MKRKPVNIFVTIIVVLAMIGLVAFYLYDVFVMGTPFRTNLFRVLAVFFTLCGTLVKLNFNSRKNLLYYEKAYADVIKYAFKNNPVLKKKLLCACRLYDESNYRKAMKYLVQLLREAEFDRDRVVVLTFIALCYTDSQLYDDAIKVYYDLLKLEPNNSRAHSNLGLLYVTVGDFDMALQHYNKAVECDSDNYYAFSNRANCYFRKNDYGKAIADAQKALEIKNNGVEAASLLTIIFALQGDEENYRNYYHIAITSGKSPQDIKEAIEYFSSENEPLEKE